MYERFKEYFPCKMLEFGKFSIVDNKLFYDNKEIINLSEVVYNRCGVSCTGEVPEYVLTQSKKIAQSINLKFGSVDFLFDGSTYYFCECNSSIGLKSLFNCNVDIVKILSENLFLKNTTKLSDIINLDTTDVMEK